MPNAHATRILIEDGRAAGVEYRTPKGLETARARGEVIVSGGVYGSPQLLLLSGVGPGAHLQEMGVAVVRDLPAVGANLHDHFNSYVAWRATKTGTLNDLALSPTRKVAAGIQYALGRNGPLSGISTLAGILARSDPRFDRPDLQMNIFLWSIEKRDRHGHLRPQVAGFCHLAGAPAARRARQGAASKAPIRWARRKIEFKFLETAHDVDAMLYGLRLARKIAAQPALKPYIGEEVQPGPAVTSDEALIEDTAQPRRLQPASGRHLPHGAWRRRGGRSAFAGAGIPGLRVMDASIMPQVVGGNTNAPSIMIGEKGAAMILEDATGDA